jgi:hypothetical protein
MEEKINFFVQRKKKTASILADFLQAKCFSSLYGLLCVMSEVYFNICIKLEELFLENFTKETRMLLLLLSLSFPCFCFFPFFLVEHGHCIIQVTR